MNSNPANRQNNPLELRRIAGGDLPMVAIVGRANAGKSTLFNRIAGGNRAIVSGISGTTRDINFARVKDDGPEFILVDSGGLEPGEQERLTEKAVARALEAVAAADVIVFLFDGRAGLTPVDEDAFNAVRETGKRIVVAINKIDNPGQEIAATDFHALGVDRLLFVSAAHGLGVGELLDEISANLTGVSATEKGATSDFRIALIGRPNVGKSSLLNRLAGFERSLVDIAPGTTRDPVNIRLDFEGGNLLLIDTAGIRRKTRVEGELEHRSVAMALATIKRADVLMLVCDASEAITDQDARLARLVHSHGRGLVLVCNKWDLAAQQGRRMQAFVRDAHANFPFIDFAPMVFTSAVTGDGVAEILPAALKVGRSWRANFQTALLNRILAEATGALDPPVIGRRRLKLMYVTQIRTAPPRLAIFANLERDIPAHYVRFLEARFRAALKPVGTPLEIEFRRAGSSRGGARGADAKRARSAGAGMP